MMGGEYAEQEAIRGEATPNMFSRFHQQQSQPQYHPFIQHAQPIALQLSRDSQTSEEDDSRSTAPTPNPNPNATTHRASSTVDGPSIEVVRRPRGRPPGSKNRPKPPIYITRDAEPAMSPYILEVPSGTDVIEAVARFSRRRNIGLCVLTGSGTVANVIVRQSTSSGVSFTFPGHFDILSISATFLPQQSGPLPPVPNGFAISLFTPQGQVVGGYVVGRLIAVGTVYVIAASFNNPSYQRLRAEEDVQNSVSGRGDEGQSPPLSGGGEESGHAPAESHRISMHSFNLPSDGIWSIARPPQPPPY